MIVCKSNVVVKKPIALQYVGYGDYNMTVLYTIFLSEIIPSDNIVSIYCNRTIGQTIVIHTSYIRTYGYLDICYYKGVGLPDTSIMRKAGFHEYTYSSLAKGFLLVDIINSNYSSYGELVKYNDIIDILGNIYVTIVVMFTLYFLIEDLK